MPLVRSLVTSLVKSLVKLMGAPGLGVNGALAIGAPGEAGPSLPPPELRASSSAVFPGNAPNAEPASTDPSRSPLGSRPSDPRFADLRLRTERRRFLVSVVRSTL